MDRLSPWASYVVKPEKKNILDQHFWNPSPEDVSLCFYCEVAVIVFSVCDMFSFQTYKFKNRCLPRPKALRIYEAHVGIASPEGVVATYKNFTHNVLPRISKLGTIYTYITVLQERLSSSNIIVTTCIIKVCLTLMSGV